MLIKRSLQACSAVLILTICCLQALPKNLNISNSALKIQSYNNKSLQGKTALEGELILVSGFQGLTENWAKNTPL